MNECRKCKAVLDVDDKFCVACGTKVIAETARCSDCDARLQPDDIFCSDCGKKVEDGQPKCPACEAIVEAGDKHCYSCGIDLSKPVQAAPVWRPEPAKVDKICAICEHYRKIIPLSSKIPYWTGTAISQALIKIEEDQVKQSAAEASHKAHLVDSGETHWDRRPIMAAYCAAKADEEIYEVCEVKNLKLNCPDFEMRTGNTAECKSCLHLQRGNKDPYPPQGALTPDLYTKQLEAIDADIALEITALWATKGVPGRSVLFHDLCTLHGLARPYINLHKDCKTRFHYIEESELFSNMRKRQKK